MRPAGEVLEQVEQSRRGPVDVLEHHHDRLLAGELLEQPAHRPEHLAAGCELARRPDRAQHSLGDELRVFGPGEDLAYAVLRTERPDDLDQRPERDSVAVGQAAPADGAGLVSESRRQLGCESGLSDAGRPHERDEVTGTLRRDGCEDLPELAQLAFAPDERSVETPRIRRCALDDAQNVPRHDGTALSLPGELVPRFQQGRIGDEAARVFPEQDLSGPRRFLQPLRHVDGVAGDEHLPARSVACDHLAGVEADADADVDAELLAELVVQSRQRLAQLGRCTDRAQGIVLV